MKLGPTFTDRIREAIKDAQRPRRLSRFLAESSNDKTANAISDGEAA